jgi:hypothetical protein
LWRNFGRIVGTRLPDWLGFLLFTVVLAALLIGVAVGAYIYDSVFWLSVLFGARIGDSVVSHWWLRWQRLSVPNPGIYSTVLYVVEAAVIVWSLSSADEVLSLWGVLIGVGFFLLVLPLLWVAGRLNPGWAMRLGGSETS